MMFFVLFVAIYLKVLVDTFCSGDAKDVECLKKTLLDLAGGEKWQGAKRRVESAHSAPRLSTPTPRYITLVAGAISWRAPFHKLYDGVAAPPS